jgi:membrane protein DedA with SNARE-associated domain
LQFLVDLYNNQKLVNSAMAASSEQQEIRMEEYLREFGYLALFIGTFLEGETILIIAAYLASKGMLNIYLVMLSAVTGTVLGDQTYFYIGRIQGISFIQKRPKLKKKWVRISGLIERRENIIILAYRFVYGFRNITPFALGILNINAMKFLVLNVIAASVWAISFSVLGYTFGAMIRNDIETYEKVFALGILFITVLVAFIYWLKKRIKNEPILPF